MAIAERAAGMARALLHCAPSPMRQPNGSRGRDRSPSKAICGWRRTGLVDARPDKGEGPRWRRPKKRAHELRAITELARLPCAASVPTGGSPRRGQGAARPMWEARPEAARPPNSAETFQEHGIRCFALMHAFSTRHCSTREPGCTTAGRLPVLGHLKAQISNEPGSQPRLWSGV
jgi:hypothetical protein